jgi:FKBP-type peptidyl-prolyl cis-trans isomerase SlyD
MSQKIQKNKLVSITYRILNEENEVLEQSDTPIDYVHGIDGRMYPKIIEALEGKEIGDEVCVVLSPEEGFGVPDPELIIVDDINNAPPEYRVIGAKPTFQNANGDSLKMVVTKIEDGKITVDGNHPFAGKTMTFLVEVIGVRNPDDAPVAVNTPGPTTLQ